MRTAAKVDANQPEIVAALRSAGYLVQSLAAIGGGVPDLLVCTPDRSRLLLMEVKDGSLSPSRRELTPDQREWHAAWRGAPVFVVTDVTQALGSINTSPATCTKTAAESTQGTAA